MQSDKESSIKAWREQATLSLASDQFLPFLTYTTRRLSLCAKETLSSYFLQAVLERVLFETSQQFAFFNDVSVKDGNFDFTLLHTNRNSHAPNSIYAGGLELVSAFVALIYQLTGGVLPQNMYDELAFITVKEMNLNFSDKEAHHE